MSGSSGPTLITSVVRALSLLDAVGDQQGPATAKRLARLTGLPLATTYHLLRTLLHEGYLEREEGGYVLGAQVYALADRRLQRAHLAHRALRTLQQEAHAAAYLSQLDGDRVRLIDVADSPTTPRTEMWVDFEDAAHATAIGKAVLASLPEDRRRDYLSRHPLVDLTASTVTSASVLLDQLRRSPGRATDVQEYAVGTTCLAVPVPTRTAHVAVAISVPTSQRLRLPCQVAPLRRAAQSVALAYDTGAAASATDFVTN